MKYIGNIGIVRILLFTLCILINRLYGIFHIACHINPRLILALELSLLGLIWMTRFDMTTGARDTDLPPAPFFQTYCLQIYFQ